MSIEVIGIYIPPETFKEEGWEALRKLGARKRAIYIGDLNGWKKRFRDSYPTKFQNHRNTTHMAEAIAELELIDTLQSDVFDITQMAQWEYDVKDHPARGSLLNHILTTGDCRAEMTYSRVVTAGVSDHILVSIKWRTNTTKPSPRWMVKPSTIRHPEWRKLMEETVSSAWGAKRNAAENWGWIKANITIKQKDMKKIRP